MAEFTYNDYLLHKVIQPYSLRGQDTDAGTLKKNVPLYLTRQAGKVREKYGNLDSKDLITKQAIQAPQNFVDAQFDKVQAQSENLLVRKPGIDTNIGMNRTVKSIFDDDNDINGKKDPILNGIRNRIAMEKYTDDFFVLVEGAKQINTKKEEKLSIEKQMKTVLQEKVNEDQLKKLHRKYVLETMKRNIKIDKKTQQFTKKPHEVQVGSLTKISEIPFLPKHDFGRAASMVNIQMQRFGKSGSIYHNSVDTPVNKEEPIASDNNGQATGKNSPVFTSSTSRRSYLFGGKDTKENESGSNSMPPKSSISQDLQGHIGHFQDEQAKQLAKLKEINNKQQSYKFNSPENEKSQIQNICGFYNLNVPKLFQIEDNKQMKETHIRNLADISLDSGDEDGDKERQEEEEAQEQEFLQKDEDEEEEVKYQGKSSQFSERENKALYDRFKFVNEETSSNQQDVKIINSILRLENKQQYYSRYIQQQKKLRQLQAITEQTKLQSSHRHMGQGSGYITSNDNNQSNHINPTFKLQNVEQTKLNKIIQKANPANNAVNFTPPVLTQPQSVLSSGRATPLLAQKSITPTPSSPKIKQTSKSTTPGAVPPPQNSTNSSPSLPQHKVLPPNIFKTKPKHDLYGYLGDNSIEERNSQRNSYRFSNGKPIHEESVLSFLRSDYNVSVDNKSATFSKHSSSIKPCTSHVKHPSEGIDKNRLAYLSTPKYGTFGLDFKYLRNGSLESASMMGEGSISNQSTTRKTKVKCSDLHSARIQNKADIDKLKLNFLNFFDSCFEQKHQFTDEKQQLRQEISDWYCSNQSDLNKLSGLTLQTLSTLSTEFQAFIEQKKFKKKLFNYLINSLEQKDRQMAVYLYKQSKQLDDI